MTEQNQDSPENQPSASSILYLRSLLQFHDIARLAGDERGLDLANHLIADELCGQAGESDFDPTAGPAIELPIDVQATTLHKALEEQEAARRAGDEARYSRANQVLLWLSERYQEAGDSDSPPKQ